MHYTELLNLLGDPAVDKELVDHNLKIQVMRTFLWDVCFLTRGGSACPVIRRILVATDDQDAVKIEMTETTNRDVIVEIMRQALGYRQNLDGEWMPPQPAALMQARQDWILLNEHILTVDCTKEVFQQARFCAVCLRPCFRIQIAGREYRHYWSRHRSEHARGGSIEAAKNHASSCFVQGSSRGI